MCSQARLCLRAKFKNTLFYVRRGSFAYHARQAECVHSFSTAFCCCFGVCKSQGCLHSVYTSFDSCPSDSLLNLRIVQTKTIMINEQRFDILATCSSHLFRAWNSSRKRGFSRKWKSKTAEKNFFRGKKIFRRKNKLTSILFFLKTVRQCNRKCGNHSVNECEFARKIECWWSYRSWTFAYFKLFPWRKYTAGPDWSKKFVKPMNIDFAFEA